MGSFDLCPTCESIDIRQFQQDEYKRAHLGALGHILKKSNSCNLCFLVAELIKAESREESPQDLGTRQCYLLRYKGGDGIEVRVEPALFPNHVSTRHLEAVVDERLPLDQQRTHRILLHSKVDFDTIRLWQRVCREQHAAHCSDPGWLRPTGSPTLLRVIDIRTRAVIEAPPNCVYAALSYTWGDPRHQVMANQKDLVNLRQRSFRLPSSLPATVEDAISVADKLGIRYIWVDALCIVQEPRKNPDKSHHLQQMDRIFKSAEVTIVAAGCEAASDRIPGIARREDVDVARIVQGTLLAVSKARFGDDMFLHTWNRRAWTYQEFMLTRRAVVFGKSQAWWACQCDLWSESNVSEPKEADAPGFVPRSLPDTTHPPERILPMITDADPAWPWNDAVEDNNNTLKAYDKLVTEYSTRKMTYPDDGLNAAAGLLNVIRSFDPGPWRTMYYGLPEAFFDMALLWIPRTTSKRPENWATAKLPSWSWAGWFSNIGEGVLWDGSTFDETIQIETAIDWYIVDEHRRSIELAKYPRPRGYWSRRSQKSRTPIGAESDRTAEQPPELPISLPRWPGYFLHFLTTTAKLYLGSDIGWSDIPYALNGPQPTSHYSLEDTRGEFVGMMAMAEAVAEQIRKDRQPLECIFLAYVDQCDWGAPRKFMHTGKEHIYIMWISRQPEGYVERVLLGKALADSWLATKPVTEWIILG